MTGLNRTLLATMTPGMFITMFWVSLDETTGAVRYSNGGHNPALLLRANGEAEWLQEGGTILGMLQGFPYACGGTPGPGRSPHPLLGRRHRGHERRRRPVRRGRPPARDARGRGGTPAELIQTLLAAVKAHEGGLPPGDDKTLLVTTRG